MVKYFSLVGEELEWGIGNGQIVSLGKEPWIRGSIACKLYVNMTQSFRNDMILALFQIEYTITSNL